MVMQERISADFPLVLGSASPRRRELLAAAGIPHEVLAVDIDESLAPGERPDSLATRLARQKGAAVVYALGKRGTSPEHRWILAADTIVHVGAELLGKPRDEGDARRMLKLLSGRSHAVTTGFVIHGADAFDAPAYAETTGV